MMTVVGNNYKKKCETPGMGFWAFTNSMRVGIHFAAAPKYRFLQKTFTEICDGTEVNRDVNCREESMR